MSENPNDEVWIDQFKKVGKSASLWQQSARHLVCAANVLYHRELRIPREAGIAPSGIFIALMLYGLALENLLKGLLVARGLEATSTGHLSRKLRHHRLRLLCQETGIDISSDEADLLEELQRLIESAKYPFGVHPRLGKARRGIIVPTDFKLTFALIDRVEETLREAAPDRTLERIDLRSLCVDDEGTAQRTQRSRQSGLRPRPHPN